MRRLRLLHLTPVLVSAVCVGCFDPALGSNPFQCATSGKACPDGYHCSPSPKAPDGICIPEDEKLDASAKGEKHVLTDAELAPSKEGPVRIDGAVVKNPSNCADVASEPNNFLVDAKGSKVTDLTFKGSGSIPGWEICYSGDIDVYSWTRSVGDKLVVEVKFYHKQGDLEAALFDPDGLVLDTSRSETDDEEVSMSTAAVAGKYLVAVWGFKDATNTYDLYVTTD
jgi:hypothetical protein